MPRSAAALLVLGLLAGSAALLPASPASAGSDPVYAVATTDDELDSPPGAGDLSLREAVQLANTDGAQSVIDLAPGATYELDLCGPAESQEDANVDGDLDHAPPFAHSLQIRGIGATIRQTCPGERVIDHLPQTTLRLDEITITGGDAVGRGGGVRATGSVGRVEADEVTIVGNRATDGGGGIYALGSGAVTDSTITENVNGAERGGGLWVASGALELRRSTVSHNVSQSFGGGVAGVAVTIEDSTIVANGLADPTSGSGSNLVVSTGTLRSSIVALGAGGEVDCFEFNQLTSTGDNLDEDGSCTDDTPGDVRGAHPQLGPLADNGGPTATHRPAVGSPTFDAIAEISCASTLDQRGEPRPQPAGGSCDLGSVEEPAAPCTPPAFTDVGTTHPFFDDVCWMDQMAITTGFPGGAFQPSAAVTRQSMAAFLYRFALSPPFVAPGTPSFSDVGVSHPFFHEVEWLASTGIADGFEDGTYRPAAQVSRQAMAAFLFRIGGNDGYVPPTTSQFGDVGTGHPFFREIHWTASDAAVSTGYDDGTWRPANPVSRQAMSAFLHRMAEVPFLTGL
jgi:predicted outer membrane repeat protein